MKPEPVDTYPAPRYPTRLEALADQRFLHDHLPPAWRSNLQMQGMIALFLAVSAVGCQQAGQSPPPKTGEPQQVILVVAEPAAAAPKEPKVKSAPSSAVVAPLFEHGDGRGSVGCVMIAPPVFLSEEDALSVVREELAKAGVQFNGRRAAVEGVDLKRSRIPRATPALRPSYELDAVDTEHNFAIEFVSTQDADAIHPDPEISSVHGFDTKETAKEVSKALQQSKRAMYFGVLYDPCAFIMPDHSRPLDWKQHEEATRQEAMKQLRAQVQDFVNWLHGQGAI